MKFSTSIALVMAELGVGTAWFVLWQQMGEIRKSFFSFQSILVGISLLIAGWVLEGNDFWLSPWIIPGLLALLAGHQFSRNHSRRGQVLLAAAAGIQTGWIFLILGGVDGKDFYFHGINWFAGMLLFGWSNGAMILGHWYLVMRGLSFVHFQRATRQLLVLVVFRALGTAIMGWFWVKGHGWQGAAADPLFFWSRMVWGLVLPGAFSWMAWRCAAMGSNQAGTGLLYIAEVAVLIGEILAVFVRF